MIVVCGELTGKLMGGASPAAVARAAAAAGATVQVVGLVSDDADGDRRLLEFAAAGIGHVAVLRGPARELEAADVDLALRYLPEIRVIVTVGVPPAILATASEHASWSGAALVAVTFAAPGAAGDQPMFSEGAVVLEAPPSDLDGTFAGFVGAFAARSDAGATPADAWAATTKALAVDAV